MAELIVITGIAWVLLIAFSLVMFRALLQADAQLFATIQQPDLHEGEPMKAENPWRDIVTALQGRTVSESIEIMDAVKRFILEKSMAMEITPDIERELR